MSQDVPGNAVIVEEAMKRNPVRAANSTDRSRRHRENLKKDCTRIDITIGSDVAEKLKDMAKQRGVPRWKVVEDAIQALPAAF